MPGIYYKPFCPYLESPNPRPDDTENTDTPLKICGDIIMSQADQIVTMARERWVEKKTLEQLSRVHGIGPKRVRSILKTLQFKIVGKCIEPYRIR